MPAINFGQLEQAIGLSPGLSSVAGIVSTLVTYIFVFAGFALLLYIISGGFKLMTSSGDPGKVKEGQAVITQGIIGFVIIFVAYWIVQLVGTIFGIGEIQNIFR